MIFASTNFNRYLFKGRILSTSRLESTNSISLILSTKMSLFLPILIKPVHLKRSCKEKRIQRYLFFVEPKDLAIK